MKPSNSLFTTYLQLHFIVLIWGFTAILGMLISISPVELVFYRTLFSVIGLYVLLKLSNISFRISQKDMLKMLLTGGIIAIHWITFFLAARLSNISICLVGMATGSLWTSLIDPLISKRKFQFYEPLLGIIALIGISVVFTAVIDSWLGFLIAVCSAMMSAVFTVINGIFIKNQHHHTINFYEMAGAFISVALFLPVYSYFFTNDGLQLGLTVSDSFYLIILAVVCTVYAYSLGIKLMHKLTAFSINLAVNLEPVYGIILAYLLFTETEQMDSNFYWGAAIILLSVLLHPVLEKMKT